MRLFSFSADFATHIMEKQLAQWQSASQTSEEVIGSSPILLLYFLFWTKGESMNIEQFELILCDMYTMDAWSPPLIWKWKKEFKEASTKQWAIRELENYIRKRLHDRSDGSVDEFIRFTNEFAMKMARYSNHSGENQEMHEIFQTASSVAADILDLLNAMK